MKKSTIAILIILALLVIGIVYKYTGGVIAPQVQKEKGACLDTDGGDNKFAYGEATYENRDEVYQDECYGKGAPGDEKNWLKERFCLADHIETKKYHCENGCKDGACIEAS